MNRKEKRQLEKHIQEVLKQHQENPRAIELELRSLIEARRGPHGRVIFVPRGAPLDVAHLGIDDQIHVLGILDAKRKSKRIRYLRKLADGNYHGPKIVAEGDSWFEYPCSKDLIEWIGESYAVLSLAKAGDTWADINSQEGQRYDDGTPMGLFETISSEKPQIVLLSVGGNEIVGNTEQFVYPYDKYRPRDKYIDESKFSNTLDYIQTQYQSVTDQIVLDYGAKVILHGYDYPDPRDWYSGGQWIGGPLEAHRYIGDQSLWRQIADIMLKRFADRLYEIARKSRGHVHVINQLGTIGNADYNQVPDRRFWFDELHGTDQGFEKLSKRFLNEIKRIALVESV
jgi:hypothetical protein